MIRYPATRALIEQQIRALRPNWLDLAARRTGKFVREKKFNDGAPIWSQVKPVFMKLQHNKCIFCEQKIEGTIANDLEHFRPKSSVTEWPMKSRGLKYDFPTGKASASGYYWLAYDVENYAAACKQCNTPYKSNFFPVAGKRAATRRPVARLKDEQPLLCYPIGTLDDDPESLVSFSVTTAIPVKKKGARNRRGRVIIDFFELNKRELLHEGRAMMLGLLGDALARLENGNDPIDVELVATLQSSSSPHAACLRAFRRLWDDDRAMAREAIVLCKKYLITRDLRHLVKP
jgi:hypothetical protein